MNSLKKNYPVGFIAFASLVFIFIFLIENLNHRFWLNDFKVYYSAAHAFLNGEKIYGVVTGLDTGLYKYAPVVLLFFTPYCLFSYSVACIIHFIILSASCIVSVMVINNILSSYFFFKKTKKESILLSIALLCIAIHLIRELHLGNINIILLLLVSVSLLDIQKLKYNRAGIFLAIAIICKPYFLILILPLLAFKKWKVIRALCSSLIAAMIVSVLVFGFSGSVILHQEWIGALQRHNATLTSNHTLQSLIQYYFHVTPPGFLQFVIIVLISLLFLFLFRGKKNADKSHNADNVEEMKSQISGYFSLFAIVPNLVITDTQHFLFSLPLIMIWLNYIAMAKNYLHTGIFIVVIFFFGGNSTDLFGKTLSLQFDTMGLLGISNLILISTIIYLFLIKREAVKS